MIELNENIDIRIDKEGIWYFYGEEMKRQDIVQYLYSYFKRDRNGRYLIENEHDRCYVAVEDVPYIIKSAELGCSSSNGQPVILISLSDGNREELNLDTPFWFGEGNVMYCRVKRGEFTARFSRPAYYQLCGHIEHDSARGSYVITFKKSSYPLILIDQQECGGFNVR